MMKHWVFRITICLILGTVTTVGVAWGLVINPDVHAGWLEPHNGDNYGAFVVPSDRRFAEWGHHTVRLNPGRVSIAYMPGLNANSMAGRIDAERYTAALPAWSRFRNPSSVSQTYDQLWTRNRFVSYHELAAGWPMKAMGSSYLWALDRNNIEKGSYHIAVDALGAPLSLEFGDDRDVHLPLRPLLPGFLINTLFYAIIWLGLLCGLTSFRRAICRRRGRCPMCAYDLRGVNPHPQPLSQRERGVSGCPECGWGRIAPID